MIDHPSRTITDELSIRSGESYGILVGESEPDLEARNQRPLHVVAKAESKRCPESVLREHAPDRYGRCGVLVL